MSQIDEIDDNLPCPGCGQDQCVCPCPVCGQNQCVCEPSDEDYDYYTDPNEEDEDINEDEEES